MPDDTGRWTVGKASGGFLPDPMLVFEPGRKDPIAFVSGEANAHMMGAARDMLELLRTLKALVSQGGAMRPPWDHAFAIFMKDVERTIDRALGPFSVKGPLFMPDEPDPDRWPAGNQSNPGTTTTPNPPPDSGLTDRPPQDAPDVDPALPSTRERPVGSPAETGIDPGVARRWEEQEEERRRAEAAAAQAQAAPPPGPVTGTPAAAPTSPEGAEKPPPIPPGEPRPAVANPKDEPKGKRR